MPCLDFVAGSAFALECAGLGAGRGDGFRPIAEGVEMLYVRLAVADAAVTMFLRYSLTPG